MPTSKVTTTKNLQSSYKAIFEHECSINSGILLSTGSNYMPDLKALIQKEDSRNSHILLTAAQDGSLRAMYKKFGADLFNLSQQRIEIIHDIIIKNTQPEFINIDNKQYPDYDTLNSKLNKYDDKFWKTADIDKLKLIHNYDDKILSILNHHLHINYPDKDKDKIDLLIKIIKAGNLDKIVAKFGNNFFEKEDIKTIKGINQAATKNMLDKIMTYFDNNTLLHLAFMGNINIVSLAHKKGTLEEIIKNLGKDFFTSTNIGIENITSINNSILNGTFDKVLSHFKQVFSTNYYGYHNYDKLINTVSESILKGTFDTIFKEFGKEDIKNWYQRDMEWAIEEVKKVK